MYFSYQQNVNQYTTKQGLSASEDNNAHQDQTWLIQECKDDSVLGNPLNSKEKIR